MQHTLGISRRANAAGDQPISRLMYQALSNPELISLAAGFVDSTQLPIEETARAWHELSRSPLETRSALQYGTNAGLPELRDMIRQQYTQVDKIPDQSVDLEQIVLTAGSNQLLHLVSEALLDPGDIVLCAAPTYFVYLGTLKNLDAEAQGVACDEHGLLPDALDERLAELEGQGQLHRVKLIYLVSYFDNPRGTSMSTSRREEILHVARNWSKQQKIYIIDDQAYRQLRYEGNDIRSMLSYDSTCEHCIIAGTFSKSFAPGIRVGWGFLPKELCDPVLALKGNIDFGSPNLNQHLMASVVRLGLLDQSIQRFRLQYRRKRDAMLQALQTQMGDLPDVHWIRPAGGLYVWLTLPADIDTGPEGELWRRSVNSGVLYVPGGYFYPQHGEPIQRNTIRLSFGVQPTPAIEQGIQSLAEAVRACHG